jgi:hypothetical protein
MEEQNSTSTETIEETHRAVKAENPPPIPPSIYEALDGQVVALQLFDPYYLVSSAVSGQTDFAAGNDGKPMQLDIIRGGLTVLKDHYETRLLIETNDPGDPRRILRVILHPSMVKYMSASGSPLTNGNFGRA